MLARPRSSLICALCLGLALVVAGHAQSASAAIAGLQRVQASSPTGSSNATVTVTCPPGKQVVGGGADIIGAANVAINDVVPDATLNAITAAADEDATGTTNSWVLQAYANCAPPLPGLEKVITTSPEDSQGKTVTAACPASKRVVGAGGEISAGGGQVVLEDIGVHNMASVTVQGVETQGGTASTWFARAYAICANPVAGLRHVAVTSGSNSTNKNAVATSRPQAAHGCRSRARRGRGSGGPERS